MHISKNASYQSLGGISLFGNLKVLLISGLFIALSIVLGKQLSFTMGPIRISFENLTILMAGIMFGPLVGMTVGICADVIGCIIVGYAINPLVTLGAASIGLISGSIYFYMFKDNPKLRLIAAVGLAHIIGSMIIKSIGLYIYFSYPMPLILMRIPLYIVIGTVEGYIIYLLMKNKTFANQLERVQMR